MNSSNIERLNNPAQITMVEVNGLIELSDVNLQEKARLLIIAEIQKKQAEQLYKLTNEELNGFIEGKQEYCTIDGEKIKINLLKILKDDYDNKIFDKTKIIRTDADIKQAVELWKSNRCKAIQVFGHISDWNTTQVKDMSSLFQFKENFKDDISMWDVSNVIDMSGMFHGLGFRESLFNQDISGWDVSNVKDMQLMFCHAHNFNCDLSRWDVKNVRSMRFMFKCAKKFNGNISTWVLKSITVKSSIKDIYEDCNISPENQIKITYYNDSWDEEEYDDDYNEYNESIEDELRERGIDRRENGELPRAIWKPSKDAEEEAEEGIGCNKCYSCVSGGSKPCVNEKVEIVNKIYDDYTDGYDTEEEEWRMEQQYGDRRY